MPTHEAVSATLTPKEPEKPIPTRVVATKPRKIEVTENSGQQITNDVPAAESAPVPEESVRISGQASAILRKEQAVRQREEALKQRERDLADKLALAEQHTQLTEKLKAKDYSEAEKLGMSYEDYTSYKLNSSNEPDPLQEKIKALEDKVASFEQREEQNSAVQYEETIAEYKKEIGRLVADRPEFSSIKELKKEDAVLQLILDTFEEDGEELSIDEAARFVEEKLVEYGKAFTALPKLKTEEPPQRVLPRPVVGRTLTNDMTVTSDKAPMKSLRGLSDAERYAEARRRVEARKGK